MVMLKMENSNNNAPCANKRNSSLHKGHRERMRKRLLKSGFESFSEHEILEMLLYYSVPRKDTNEQAHFLLDEFKSIDNLINADIEMYKDYPISENTIALFKIISGLISRSKEEISDEDGDFDDTDIHERLIRKFMSKKTEIVIAVLLDSKGHEISFEVVEKGGISSVDLDIRKIVGLCVSKHAASIILSHNHPSGLALPSDKDVSTTKKLKKALDGINVRLADHIIVSGRDYVSMANMSVYSEIFLY